MELQKPLVTSQAQKLRAQDTNIQVETCLLRKLFLKEQRPEAKKEGRRERRE